MDPLTTDLLHSIGEPLSVKVGHNQPHGRIKRIILKLWNHQHNSIRNRRKLTTRFSKQWPGCYAESWVWYGLMSNESPWAPIRKVFLKIVRRAILLDAHCFRQHWQQAVKNTCTLAQAQGLPRQEPISALQCETRVKVWREIYTINKPR